MRRGKLLAAVAVVMAPFAWVAAGETTLADQAALRARAREAFAKGDYEAMAEALQPLAALALPDFERPAENTPGHQGLLTGRFDDALALGHAYQLAGKWAEAVQAYQNGVSLIDAALRSFGAEARPEGLDEGPPWVNTRPAPARQAPLWLMGLGRTEEDFLLWRAGLLLRIGRMQREGMKDLAGAAATFAKVVERGPALRRGLDELLAKRTESMRQSLADIEKGTSRPQYFPGREFYGALSGLAELAATQEAMGQAEAAIESRNKVNLQLMMLGAYSGIPGLNKGYLDVEAVGRLLQKLPPGKPLPRTLFVSVLSPEAPTKRLDPLDPRTLAEAWKPMLGKWSTATFVFSPPPGKEFASIELTCDIEQTELHQDPAVTCYAKTPGPAGTNVPIGSAEWPPAKGPGRQVIRRRLEVPPGAGLLYVDVKQREGKAAVRSVEATGEFRPRQDAVLVAPALVRSEVMPWPGTLTCNGEPMEPGVKPHELDPGRYVFEYRVGGDPRRFRCQADLVAGAEYRLFINLDSPFEWQLTNLRGFGESLPARPALARLPDGRWLVAYGGEDKKVHLSTSQDLLKWEPAWILPHEALFESVEPALYVDDGGTVWLAYFGTRASWSYEASGIGSRIWLTSTRDGRAWSRPRPVLLTPSRLIRGTWRDDFETSGSSPRGPLQMLRGPDGRFRMIWGAHAGSAESPDRLMELGPCRGVGYRRRLVFGPGGVQHIVFESFSSSIQHSTSTDGEDWSAPTAAVQSPDGPNGRLSDPHLILDGDRAAIIAMNRNFQSWLFRGAFGPPAQFAAPINVAHGRYTFGGAQPYVTPDNQVLFLAGTDTVWLLRTTLTRLTRAVQEF